MKAFINDNNKEYDWIFWLMTIVICVRFVFYAIVAVKGIGTIALGNYLSLAINFLMYSSILTYMIDYFKKGKEVTIDSMIFRFGIASMASLIGLKNGNDTLFVLTAVMVFIVPGISFANGINKKTAISMIIVLGLSIACSVMYIVYPSESYLNALGDKFYYVDAINPTVEWIMFCVLTILRGKVDVASGKAVDPRTLKASKESK